MTGPVHLLRGGQRAAGRVPPAATFVMGVFAGDLGLTAMGWPRLPICSCSRRSATSACPPQTSSISSSCRRRAGVIVDRNGAVVMAAQPPELPLAGGARQGRWTPKLDPEDGWPDYVPSTTRASADLLKDITARHAAAPSRSWRT